MKASTFCIDTERLKLREFQPDDALCFYNLNQDEEVMRYTGDVAFESVDAAREFIAQYDHYAKHGYGRWSVILKTSGRCIGWCGLKWHPEEGYVDLGYRLERNVWGNGLATEAARVCIDYGFNRLNFDEIIGRTAKANLASIKVLQKVGMSYWKDAPCEGIENSVFYKIRKDDTRARFAVQRP